jgi:hypothetical protein
MYALDTYIRINRFQDAGGFPWSQPAYVLQQVGGIWVANGIIDVHTT